MRGRSDRPPARRLWKLALRLRHGARLAHAQDWTPGLSLGGGRIVHRGRVLGALGPWGPPGAAPLAIVGSGPSLARQGLSGLDPARAILLNGAIALGAGPMADAGTVAVEDERFVWRRPEMLAAAPRGAHALLSVQAIRAIAESAPDWLADRPVTLIENLAKPYRAPRRALDDPALADLVDRGHGAPLSAAPQRGVVPYGTIALSALQFALGTAARRIRLVGIDLSNAALPRFNETAGDRAPSGLAAGMDRILAGFGAALGLARARGVALECAAPGSALLDLGYPLVPLPERAA